MRPRRGTRRAAAIQRLFGRRTRGAPGHFLRALTGATKDFLPVARAFICALASLCPGVGRPTLSSRAAGSARDKNRAGLFGPLRIGCCGGGAFWSRAPRFFCLSGAWLRMKRCPALKLFLLLRRTFVEFYEKNAKRRYWDRYKLV